MSVDALIRALKDMRIVELGQYLEENMPVHPSHSKFYKMTWHSPSKGDICTDYQLILNEHNGTHVDSFGHFIAKPGYEYIDDIDIERFSAPCVTIDARHLDKRMGLSREDIIKWESEYGEIQEGDAVLIDTGWMDKWALRPDDHDFITEYPGLGATGASYLVEKKVKLVGVDTLSIDAYEAKNDPAHNALLSNRVLIVENLANLKELHGKRGFFVMLPLLIRGGSASPVRPIVLIDQ
jgi:kynurenine formamidase